LHCLPVMRPENGTVPRLRQILCPVDLSAHSRHAFDYAVILARWYGATVCALEVVWPGLPPVPFPPNPEPPILRSDQLDQYEEDLRLFVEPARATGVRISTVIREGAVVKHILDEARLFPSDLIVIGTHGTSGFEHLVLGSVTEKILRKAGCPVLTVPPTVDVVPAEAAPFRKILCGVDFSPSSFAGLDYALSIANESGGKLIAVHVLDWQADLPLPDPVVDVTRVRRQLDAEAHRELSAAIPASARSQCKASTLVEVGKPHERILQVADDHKVDLIVLGVRGRKAIDLAWFGSTANHVVRAATCPVLTVRS